MEERLSHKTDNLDTYLDAISGSLDEKTAIARYIEAVRYNGARFLEIGSGGDSVASIVDQLPPSDKAMTIEVIDADPAVLDGLSTRHPQLVDNARGKNIDIVMQAMDATNMRELADGGFDAVNASSLVHEIFSYAGGFRGVSRFFSEVTRVLAPEGVLFYRDPELNDPQVYVEATLSHPDLKALSFFYLSNALKGRTSEASASSNLPQLYNDEAIHLAYYDKYADTQVILGINELSQMRLSQIDFEKDVRLYAEHGVAKELMRHFLTFHQSSPYGTVYFADADGGGKRVQYASSNTSERWEDFIAQNNITMSSDQLMTDENYVRSKRAMREAFAFMHGDTRLSLAHDQAVALRECITAQDIRVEAKESDGMSVYSVDSLQLSLHYEKLLSDGVLDEAAFVNPTAFRFYQYLKQEARETYFYLTPDELIAFAMDASCRAADGYVLVPSSFDGTTNRTARRPKYDAFLQQSMSVHSLEGTTADSNVTPCEKKRLIQFTKKTHCAAMEMFDQLSAADKDAYPLTYRVYEDLLRSGTMSTDKGL